MLASFLLGQMLLSVFVGGQSSRPPTKPTMDWTGGEDSGCCKMKMVGDKKFRLIGRDDSAFDFGCTTSCTYKTEGSDVPFCFRPGKFETECRDDGGSKPPFTGSKPPMSSKPTGSKPPFTGSKPPMSSKPPGSSKPPMTGETGSSKPPMTGSTSAAGGPEDEVMTRVKGYIDSSTCNSVTFSSYSETECGDAATSYYREFIYNDKRVVISNNIPDHPAEGDAIRPNPNVRCPGWQFMELPIDPSKGSGLTDTRLGAVGLAVTGGAFFNDLSNPDGSLALTNEGRSLDSCLGHSAPSSRPGGGGPPGRYKRQSTSSGTYHYHGNINCTDAGAATGANDPDKCVRVGYYNDGVPVYGFCKDSTGRQFSSCYKVSASASLTTVETVSGTYNVAATNTDYFFSADSDCNLDEASGAEHPVTGKYSYFMTTGYPWTPIKWAGDQGRASLCSAA